MTKLIYLIASCLAFNIYALDVDRGLEHANSQDRIVSVETNGLGFISRCWLVNKKADAIYVSFVDLLLSDDKAAQECVDSTDEFASSAEFKLTYLKDANNRYLKNESIENILKRYFQVANNCDTQITRKASIYEPTVSMKLVCDEQNIYNIVLKTNYYAEGDYRFYSKKEEDLKELVKDVVEDIETDSSKSKIARHCFNSLISANTDRTLTVNNEATHNEKLSNQVSIAEYLEFIYDCNPSLLNNFISKNGELTRLRRGYIQQHNPSQGLKAIWSVKQDIRVAQATSTSIIPAANALRGKSVVFYVINDKGNKIYPILKSSRLEVLLKKKGYKATNKAMPIEKFEKYAAQIGASIPNEIKELGKNAFSFNEKGYNKFIARVDL